MPTAPRRLIAAIAAVVLAGTTLVVTTGTGPSPADADTGGGTTAPSGIWAGVSVYEGGWRGSRSSCTWRLSGSTPYEIGPDTPRYRGTDGVLYVLYMRTCAQVNTLVWIPDLPPHWLSFDATSYLERVLPDPVPRFAPPAGSQVVTVGTWFWTARSVWTPKSVTAWVPTPSGTRWATTTARPVRLILDPGDGSWGTGAVSCAGPGSVWVTAVGDTSPSPSGCQYTYPHSSVVAANGATFPARMTIVWDVSWRSSTGASGYSGQLRTSTSVAMTVREIEALVSA